MTAGDEASRSAIAWLAAVVVATCGGCSAGAPPELAASAAESAAIAPPPTSPALEFPRAAPVSGGVVRIDLGPASAPRPEARFGARRLAVLEDAGRWTALVGIPLGTAPGPQRIEWNGVDGPRESAFAIESVERGEQRITLANDKMVNPGPEEMARIERETPRIRAALDRFTEVDRVPTAFRLPVVAPASSPFGLRRFFNGEERRPHAGLDLAAAAGTPILAPAAGEVIDVGEFYFNGNTVFIDHGRGLVTMYNHMSRIDVAAGQRVEAGTPIGRVGATGRVTAAHLHWGVTLNGTSVDPRLFLVEQPPERESAPAAPTR